MFEARNAKTSKPSNLHFSMFLGVSQHTSQKWSSCNKIIAFAMLCRFRTVSHTATARVFCMAFKPLFDMALGLLQKTPAGIYLLLGIMGVDANHGSGRPRVLPNMSSNSTDSPQRGSHRGPE